MSKVTKLKELTRVNVDNYINQETGECLEGSIVVETNSKYVLIDSEEYIVIDSEAHKYLRTYLNSKELSTFFELIDMIKTPFNIISQRNNKPHDFNTLQLELKQKKSIFYQTMSGLHKAGIIWYLVGYVDSIKVKRIIVNPHIARKRKKFDAQLLQIFKNITELTNLKLKK